MLESTSYEEFIDICNLLVSFGYCKEDLDILIMANPNLFVQSKKDLEKDLTELSQKYCDIDEVLKNNPTII